MKLDVNDMIKTFLKNNKAYLVGYIVFLCAFPITAVFLPKYYGNMINELKNNKIPKFKSAVFLIVLVNIMFWVLDIIDNIFIPKLQTYIRMNIVKCVLENYSETSEQNVGEMISKIVKLPIVVKSIASQLRNSIVPILLVLIMVVVQFSWIDPKIGAFTFVLFLASYEIIKPMILNCLKIASETDDKLDETHEKISELLENITDIHASNTCEYEIEKLEKEQDDILENMRKTNIEVNKLRLSIISLNVAIFLGLMMYAYNRYENKTLELSKTINIFITSIFIIGKINGFAGDLINIISNIGTYNRINNYITNLNMDVENCEKESFQVSKGEIIFDNVKLKYKDNEILSNFNLQIYPGQTIAIFGSIGSGKSSLVKSLLKFIPHEGDIYIDGKNLKDITHTDIRESILYIRQNPLPFNRTLYENIVYGTQPQKSKEEVKEIIKKYDLDEFLDKDLDYVVGKKGEKLSGGQRMLLFLLRILVQQKQKIIILDEPTSSLDNKTINKVIDILKHIVHKQTTIIITHDERIKKITDKTITL